MRSTRVFVFWGYEETGSLIGIMGIQGVQDVEPSSDMLMCAPAARKRGVGARLLSHLQGLDERPRS